ncbi:hypothetical protein FH972_019301 [Carpinus fangiana]|uniref:U1-type domain-containing protein n=2 Tax=Carpinus fangiana TaxID=176857 RepID=A0A5N6RSP5_9ROSI|nr:hypothetical protein FH972_019301 [Carpinus fangiana]
MDYTGRWSSQQQTPQNPNLSPIFSSIPHALMYHQTPQPSLSALSSDFSHQYHTTNPIPNPFLYFPQPVLPSSLTSNPDLHPPGTDPPANLSSYPSTHVDFHGWVSNQAEPISNEAAMCSLSENFSVSTNDASGIIPQQTKVVQSMRCEVCKIDCNSKEVYETHILGKKHKRNLQVQNCPTSAMLSSSSNTITDITTQMGSIGGQTIFGASGVAASEELEAKKRKLLDGGVVVDSVRFCTICNVACNSQEVFSKHLAGKKHASQDKYQFLMNRMDVIKGSEDTQKEETLTESPSSKLNTILSMQKSFGDKAGIGYDQPASTSRNVARLIALNGIGPYIAAIRSHDSGTLKKYPKKNKYVQSAWCEVCKINCNSSDIYIKHISGKKHQKNLEKLSKSKNDARAPAPNAPLASTKPVIGPIENPEANKGKSVVQNSGEKVAESRASEEDLETKKRKILGGGAAAEAVRTCTICNVVCNSQTVFNSHLAGQKHATMVKQSQGLN